MNEKIIYLEDDMDKNILEDILQNNRKYIQLGEVATYIPQLAKANKEDLGLCIKDMNGDMYACGDYEKKFTIQSMSKVITFTSCLLDNSIEDVKKTVSFEPTSTAFNAIVDLEIKNRHRPLNPFINAGAIACISMLKENTYQEKFDRIINFIKLLSLNENIDYDEEVYESERKTGSRNRALAYYMQSTGIIDKDVDIEKLLEVYFKICSIKVNCIDLSNIALIYANNGVNPFTKERYFSKEVSKIVVATMALCGMYDESGEIAVTVGIPSKSGVSGGILSVLPSKMGIGIYGPALNDKGTSVAGLKILESVSEKFDLSIY